MIARLTGRVGEGARALPAPRPLGTPDVYIWADGVYLQARMEPNGECLLVIIGATPEGKKELLGFHVGTRESAQSWRELSSWSRCRARDRRR
jgi:transposase-like protein